jgi:hypothetical protein
VELDDEFRRFDPLFTARATSQTKSNLWKLEMTIAPITSQARRLPRIRGFDHERREDEEPIPERNDGIQSMDTV